MGHMKPEIVGPTDWWEVDTHEGTFFVQAEFVGLKKEDVELEKLKDYVDVADVGHIIDWELKRGYGARMSAPGYLDCTDWTVFDTVGEAREHLVDDYGLCPLCLGDDCTEDTWGISCVACVASLTTEEFSNSLDRVLEGVSAKSLMDIPGICEAMSKHYNDEVVQDAYDRKVADHESKITKERSR
jgi:hypothetical protein